MYIIRWHPPILICAWCDYRDPSVIQLHTAVCNMIMLWFVCNTSVRPYHMPVWPYHTAPVWLCESHACDTVTFVSSAVMCIQRFAIYTNVFWTWHNKTILKLSKIKLPTHLHFYKFSRICIVAYSTRLTVTLIALFQLTVINTFVWLGFAWLRPSRPIMC